MSAAMRVAHDPLVDAAHDPLVDAAHDPLVDVVRQDGWAFCPGDLLARRLGLDAADLAGFAASWDRLEVDGHMADGGRYRRRRHANFAQARGVPGSVRGPHRPHFQAVAHNALNGGVDRWFAPVEDAVADGAPWQAMLGFGRALADALTPGQDWFIELHQFRIEAASGAPGYPTPEGVHQDGVELVLIAMLARTNLVGGETLVTSIGDAELARFTLAAPLDLAVLDDRRVKHGVTPVAPRDPGLASRRDVLVATWRRGAA